MLKCDASVDATRCSSLRWAGRAGSLVLITLLGAGCAVTETVSSVNLLESAGENPRILLMTPDVKYYTLTAGGLTEPHADWTAAARRNFVTAAEDYAKERGSDLISMSTEEPLSDDIKVSRKPSRPAFGNTLTPYGTPAGSSSMR